LIIWEFSGNPNIKGINFNSQLFSAI